MIKKRKIRMIGWREWLALPDLGVDAIKAKIDTGALTSALHAFNIETFERDGQPFVRFDVHPVQRRRKPSIPCEAPLLDYRWVTSSNGRREKRYVIATRLKLGTKVWKTEITLTNRDEMTFRMLIGRRALRERFVVDPGRSYVQGKPRRYNAESKKPSAAKNLKKERK